MCVFRDGFADPIPNIMYRQMNRKVLHDVLRFFRIFNQYASLKTLGLCRIALGRWPGNFRGHGVGAPHLGPIDPVGDLCPSASGCGIGEDPGKNLCKNCVVFLF